MAGPETTNGETSGAEDLLPQEQWDRARQILLTLRKRRDDERLSGDELESAYDTEVRRLPENLRNDERFMRSLRSGYEANIQGYSIDLPDDDDDDDEAENGTEGDTSTRPYTEEALKATRGFWRTKFREREIVDLPSQKEWADIELAIRRARNDEQFKAISAQYDELKMRVRGKPAEADTKVDTPKAGTSDFNKPLAQMGEEEYVAYERWLDTLPKEQRDAEITKREQEHGGRGTAARDEIKKDEPRVGVWDAKIAGEKDRELRKIRSSRVVPKGEVWEEFNTRIREMKTPDEYEAIKKDLIDNYPPKGAKVNEETKKDEKTGDGKPADPTSTVPYEKEELDNIKETLKKELAKSNADGKEDEILGEIDRITNPSEMVKVNDRIYHLPTRKDGRKGRGHETGIGRGIDLGSNPKSRRVETMPDGRIKITEVDAEGRVIERLEGSSRTATDDAWDRTLGPDISGRVRDDGTRADAARAAPTPLRRRGPIQWLRDFIRRTDSRVPVASSNEPTEEELLAELRGEMSEGERMRRALEQDILSRIERRDREIHQRKLQKFFTKEHLTGTLWEATKGATTAVAVAGLIALAVGTTPLFITALAGGAVGGFVQKYMQNRLEGIGDRSAKITSLIIGAVAGIATGTLVNLTGVDRAIVSGLSNIFGGTPTAPAAPAAVPGGASTPSATPGALPNYSGPSTIYFPADPLYSGDSVWGNFYDNLSILAEKGVTDISDQGNKALSQAFEQTAGTGKWKSQFLELGGQAISSNIPWTGLPEGTVAHFDKLLTNQTFVDRYCETIQRFYPTLANELGGTKTAIKAVIQQLAQAHIVR